MNPDIYLVSYNTPDLDKAYREALEEYKAALELWKNPRNALHNLNFKVVESNILDLDVNAVVSPANSFGFMDGGIDQVYTDHFGLLPQTAIQDTLKVHGAFGSNYEFTELLVGQAMLIDTGGKPEMLICAPTMRVPMPIKDYNDVYLASRAAAREVKKFMVPSVAFPGMGTGVGHVPYDIAARCMIKGIHEAFFPRPFPDSMVKAYFEHMNTRNLNDVI